MDTDQNETQNVQALVDELAAEKRLREELEQRVSDLTVRAELQRLGVAKVDLAFRAVRDEVRGKGGDEVGMYLAKFVADNPELLPARMAGGSGASAVTRGPVGSAVDLDQIRPGMSSEEMERVRQEIARVATQTLRGGL